MLKLKRLLICSFILFFLLTGSTLAQNTFNPGELISVENPQTVKISPDGDKILVLTQKGSLEKNRYLQSAWLLSSNTNKRPQKLNIKNRIQAIEWFPDSKRFAYLTRTRRGSQLKIKHLEKKSAESISKKVGMIRDFSISPSGNMIAFNAINRKAMAKARSKQKKKQMSSGGKEIDLLTSSAMTVLANRPSRRRSPATSLRILNLSNNQIINVAENYSVNDFSWSPDNNKIAFTAKKSTVQPSGIPTRMSDLLIYNLKEAKLSVVKKGKQPTNKIFEGVIAHHSPFWSPNGNMIGYLRINHSDRWSSLPKLGIYNINNGENRYLITQDEQDLYSASFDWLKNDKIYLELTNNARHGLYSLSVKTGNINPIKISNTHRSSFSFDSKGQRAAWIQQSINQPPEVYSSNLSSNSVKQSTNFNKEFKSYSFPDIKSITWNSTDGSKVQGWLIVPSHNNNNTQPLITLVHGGPSLVINNKFQPFLDQWAFPIQRWASAGYKIFIPNYRGTGSFGKKFMEPSAPDKEPVNDIITGIQYLISQDFATKHKLGIIGHSHGGWLAPMVAAEMPIFKAASFAEGFANFSSLYGQTEGYRNKDLHDYTVGTNPYKNPERYMELSPVFKKDLINKVPTLLEFGGKSPAVLQGFEMGKAFWRSGTPHNFVVYPNSGHSISRPKLQLESMKRNFEWFQKWLEK